MSATAAHFSMIETRLDIALASMISETTSRLTYRNKSNNINFNIISKYTTFSHQILCILLEPLRSYKIIFVKANILLNTTFFSCIKCSRKYSLLQGKGELMAWMPIGGTWQVFQCCHRHMLSRSLKMTFENN